MSIFDKIANREYETKIPYDYVMVPVDEDTMTVKQAREHIANQEKAKKNHIVIYRQDQNRLIEQFRKDLAEEYGLTNHPKEPNLWSFIYNHAHSYGLHDMVCYYEELAELLK